MKKIFIIMTLFITVNAQGQWIQQQSNQTLNNLESVYFLDSLKGFIVGYSYPGSDTSNILITTNSGDNWTVLQNYPNRHFYNITFLNSTTGYIAASQGNYMKTTNSGLNWIEFNIGSINDIFKIYFYNQDTGYALVFKSVLVTYNGGLNWNTISTNFPCTLNQICFVNKNTGYLVGDLVNLPNPPTGYIFKTTNGGYNWTTSFTSYTQFKTVIFKDTLNGITSGINWVWSYNTTNGGQNWSSSYMNNFVAWDGKYLNNGKAFLIGANGGGAAIFSSVNGGISWTNEFQTIGSYDQFHSIHFINDRIGWVVGNQKLIYKTTNGGLTFTESTINVIPDKYSLSQNYPNPFNPTTKISFALPKQGLVTIKVFDVLGKEIETLVNESLKPGTYEAAFDGSKYPSGVYFYRLTSDAFTETKRMVLIK